MIDRQQTPHAGYHWDGRTENFFEGWYCRVSLPEIRDGFAFMYSIQDPIGDRFNSGGAVQILGVGDRYLCRVFPDVRKFWASYHRLALGHWGKIRTPSRPQFLDSETFDATIIEGYQTDFIRHQGKVYDPTTEKTCQWNYSVQAIYTWGNPRQTPKATAGLLSYLPIADPGWQVTIASGLATGYIDWMGECYEFRDCPFYSEKNWGYSFPDRWFWINCNTFSGDRDLTITAVGSTRKIFGLTESVGIIGIHAGDRFYEFTIWNSTMQWQVETWGSWEMSAESDEYRVYLWGKTDRSPTSVRVPTAKGLSFGCLDTLKGDLHLKLEDSRGHTILDTQSDLAGLEIGGNWQDIWVK
jgi:tocopherol cyclase